MYKKTILALSLMVFLNVYEMRSAMGQEKSFSYENYAYVLKTYVDNTGMVNYKALKNNRNQLDSFVKSIDELSSSVFKAWEEKEQIAFWINAYNALTLKVIIDNYPIKSSFVTSLIYPKNSIRQISGVWDKITFQVMSAPMTLDEIEHEQLRKNYNEPGIHMALVCAAMSCPPLRNEPYSGEKLDNQLNSQTQRFLSDSDNFYLDKERKIFYLSSIFDWFGKDFIPSYNPSGKSGKFKAEELAVLNFISKNVDKDTEEYISKQDFKIEYIKYDWSLNEQ